MTPLLLHRRDTCRLCGSRRLITIIELAPTPPAEWYFPPDAETSTKETFPLELSYCQDCSHVQLLHVLDPVQLFANYFYESNTSPGLDQHFTESAHYLTGLLGLKSNDLIVDIGSNDGLLLSKFDMKGLRVVGIEPSYNLAEKCRQKNIPIVHDFLSNQSVNEIIKNFGYPRLITANNVFAHNDDLLGMAQNVRKLMSRDSVFVFEVSSLLAMISGKVFDWIYHEHLSYHSLTSLIPFLKSVGLVVWMVQNIDTKGGSLRVFTSRDDCVTPKDPLLSVVSQLQREKANGLHEFSRYVSFADEIERSRHEVRLELSKAKDRGRKIIGYGASATTTTLIHHFGLIDFLDFLVDDNPNRWGCLVPGTSLEVKSPSSLANLVEYDLLVTAWRFKNSIISGNLNTLRGNKVRVIVPLPSLEVLTIL